MITRRQFLKAAGVASGLGLGMYTWRWEPHWLEIVEHRLPIAYLPDGWKGARLVQLSDMHIGPRRYTSGKFALPEGRHMYISRGVGRLLRVRFNVRPEVTLFHLDRA